jgi:DNA-binding winged helix-turn-helix (wHTH) protein
MRPEYAGDKLWSHRLAECSVTLSPTENLIQFGLFELDRSALQLTRKGAKVRLARQPIQVLSLLLERPGEIVTREELRGSLWQSDVFVDFDHGLNNDPKTARSSRRPGGLSPLY